MRTSFRFAVALLCLTFIGCGVKGKPQPPLIPAFIGRGEPGVAKPQDKNKNSSQNKKKIEGDFDDSDDFGPSIEDSL